MKYATYEISGRLIAGVMGDLFYPFEDLLGKSYTMTEFIEAFGSKGIPDLLGLAKEKGIPGMNPADGNMKMKAPIPCPIREIICLGKNYVDHVNEIKATSGDIPSKPVYFAKSRFSVIGCGEDIPSHSDITSQVDYEAELAVIIGKECEDYIFGYTIINDVTARDLQAAHGQWYLGKSLDGFCPMGPVIVGKEELPLPIRQCIRSRVNGELRQNSNTSNFIFDIPLVISHLSKGMKLRPGDIIATGTPAGVGHGFSPVRNLKPGDVVECEIDGIGTLRNRVK